MPFRYSLTPKIGNKRGLFYSNQYPPLVVGADVRLLLNFNGADGATTTTDEGFNTETINFFGDAQIDNTDPKFGIGDLLLDGVNDGLSVDSSTNSFKFLHDGSAFEIECWVKVDSFGDFRTICSATRFSTQVGILFYINQTTGEPTIVVHRGVASTFVIILSHSTAITTGVWTHVYAAFSPGDNLYYIGLDGVIESATPTAAHSTADATNDLYIGLTPDSLFDFDGNIDNLFVRQGEPTRKSNYTIPTFPRSA